jgi:hypothetical protein
MPACKKRHILFILLWLISLCGFSQVQYPFDSIPLQLRTGAEAVLRSGQCRITILNEEKSRMEVSMVITLLNDRALNLLQVELPYDDLRRISSIKASAYDESGKLIWILRKYAISDTRDFGGPASLSDIRKKVFEIPAHKFPFTIAYSFVMNLRDLILSPVYYLQPDPDISVEESGLQYVFPDKLKFNYRALNCKSPIDSVHRGNTLSLSWQEENIPAIHREKYATSPAARLPRIMATPVDFSLHGLRGSFSSWQEYGRWMNKLIAGRDSLDSESVTQARELVRNIHNRKDKIRILYSYLQQHTHYFYIGFGIGGDVPIPASDVARNGFGDCKALSNYMKALLNAVGIQSYYTLVRSGEGNDIEPEIPCSQFDHVILCVPDSPDTVWLECTDPSSPFNYLGNFTQDRHVLLITPEGGKLVRTPDYGFADNRIESQTEIRINESGDAEVHLRLSESGLMYEDLNRLKNQSQDQRIKDLSSLVGSSTFRVLNEFFSTQKEKLPREEFRCTLKIYSLAFKNSDRLFLSPCLLSPVSYIPRNPDEIEINRSYQRSDTVRIEIPAGYGLEYMPEGRTFTSRFGRYACTVRSERQYVYYTRHLEMFGSTYPKSSYDEFYRFITELAASDDRYLIFRKEQVPELP